MNRPLEEVGISEMDQIASIDMFISCHLHLSSQFHFIRHLKDGLIKVKVMHCEDLLIFNNGQGLFILGVPQARLLQYTYKQDLQ